MRADIDAQWQRVETLAASGAHLEAGEAAYQTLGDLDQAELHARAAISSAPRSSRSRLLLAQIQRAQGRHSDALPVLQKLAAEPRDIASRQLLGRVLYEAGDFGASADVSIALANEEAVPDFLKRILFCSAIGARITSDDHDGASSLLSAMRDRWPDEVTALPYLAALDRLAGRRGHEEFALGLASQVRIEAVASEDVRGDLDVFNAQLETAIRADPSLYCPWSSPGQKAWKSTNQSLIGAADPTLRRLQMITLQKATRYAEDLKQQLGSACPWSVDGRRLRCSRRFGIGWYQQPEELSHLHQSEHIISIYYPTAVAERGRGGAIEFGIPDLPGKQGAFSDLAISIDPTPGMLLLAPAWAFHRILPGNFAEPRLSLPSDYIIV